MLKERAKTSGSVGVCRVSGTEKKNVLILGPQNEQIMRVVFVHQMLECISVM